MNKRINREKQTVKIMINMFCKHNHDSNGILCDDCQILAEFSTERINRCIYQNDKPVCSECQIHCYNLDMREKIKQVMRFAGPKMIYKHPIRGVRHLIDKKRYQYIEPNSYNSSKI